MSILKLIYDKFKENKWVFIANKILIIDKKMSF